MVLPYHIHSFQVTQVIPYLMDVCIDDASQCDLLNQYKDYCFSNYGNVLSMDTTSQEDFISYWSATVASELDLDQATLESLYESGDVYNSNHNVRLMWKYATSNGINGTPTARINGAKLDSTPFTVKKWINVLSDVYDSQYKAE
mmetsp:Transcript_8047/g.5727  ORF Transcript_8047/g.5727 Transcript_8047/m.5727 type:complete len:144 (-) Transcript_8047:96-527(-)